MGAVACSDHNAYPLPIDFLLIFVLLPSHAFLEFFKLYNSTSFLFAGEFDFICFHRTSFNNSSFALINLHFYRKVLAIRENMLNEFCFDGLTNAEWLGAHDLVGSKLFADYSKTSHHFSLEFDQIISQFRTIYIRLV